MGHCTDVDTTSFRRAIWNYIHSMFGIRHDDYDYNEVNQLMERSLKAYIKTVTCFPERVTKHDYDSFMKEFKHSEKVSVGFVFFVSVGRAVYRKHYVDGKLLESVSGSGEYWL